MINLTTLALKILFHTYTRYFAVACLLVSLLLILRAFTIHSRKGSPRFGTKSILFVMATACLIFSIRFSKPYRVEVAYDRVHSANNAVMVNDQAYRTAKATFKSGLNAYSVSLAKFDPNADIEHQLINVGEAAGRTLVMGESLLKEYEALVRLAKSYQGTLKDAEGAYEFAGSSLKEWATEEDALLESSRTMRRLASEEEFEELSLAYDDLAIVFEELSKNSRSRYAEIEVSLPALEEAMVYVRHANRYLATVEKHASVLSNFKGPVEILDDVEEFRKAVEGISDAINGLKRLLLQTDVQPLHAAI